MKKTPLRKVRKGATAAMKRTADALWRKYVLLKYPRCLCGLSSVDAHHIYGRKAHPWLRHEPTNGIGLCRICHNNAHSWPNRYREYLRNRVRAAEQSGKPDYAEICKRLEGMIDELLQRD